MNSPLAPLPNEERWECTSCRGPPLTNCKTGFSSPNQPSNQQQPADMIWGLFSVSKTLRFYSQSTAAAAKGKGTPLQVQHAVLTGANQINIMCILYSLPGNRYNRMLKCSWCRKNGGGSGWEESPPIESSFPRVKEVHCLPHCHIECVRCSIRTCLSKTLERSCVLRRTTRFSEERFSAFVRRRSMMD